jgi:hypothetical protein
VFQALIVAARHLESTMPGAPAKELLPDPPSLDGVLRPAISRITPKIAETLVRLGPVPSAEALGRRVREGLRTPEVSDEDAQRLANALAEYLDAGERSAPGAASKISAVRWKSVPRPPEAPSSRRSASDGADVP